MLAHLRAGHLIGVCQSLNVRRVVKAILQDLAIRRDKLRLLLKLGVDILVGMVHRPIEHVEQHPQGEHILTPHDALGIKPGILKALLSELRHVDKHHIIVL